jgi:hypothetical protein
VLLACHELYLLVHLPHLDLDRSVLSCTDLNGDYSLGSLHQGEGNGVSVGDDILSLSDGGFDTDSQEWWFLWEVQTTDDPALPRKTSDSDGAAWLPVQGQVKGLERCREPMGEDALALVAQVDCVKGHAGLDAQPVFLRLDLYLRRGRLTPEHHGQEPEEEEAQAHR